MHDSCCPTCLTRIPAYTESPTKCPKCELLVDPVTDKKLETHPDLSKVPEATNPKPPLKAREDGRNVRYRFLQAVLDFAAIGNAIIAICGAFTLLLGLLSVSQTAAFAGFGLLFYGVSLYLASTTIQILVDIEEHLRTRR